MEFAVLTSRVPLDESESIDLPTGESWPIAVALETDEEVELPVLTDEEFRATENFELSIIERRTFSRPINRPRNAQSVSRMKEPNLEQLTILLQTPTVQYSASSSPNPSSSNGALSGNQSPVINSTTNNLTTTTTTTNSASSSNSPSPSPQSLTILDKLTIELVCIISKSLSVKDLLVAKQVCTHWNRLFSRSEVWKYKFQRAWASKKVNEEELVEVKSDELVFAQTPAHEQFIKAATLRAFISEILNPNSSINVVQNIYIFLNTYRSFSSSEQVMWMLIGHYCYVSRRLIDSTHSPHWKPLAPRAVRLFNFLKIWLSVEHLELSEKSNLYLFLNGKVMADDHLSSFAPTARQLLTKFSSFKSVTPNTLSIGSRPKSMKLNAIFNMFDFSDEEIAKQLTLEQFRIFSAIQPGEFANESWMKKEKHPQCPHICELIDNFNLLSNWAALVILQSVDLRERVLKYGRLIGICEWMRKLNNFNGIYAILGGLGNSAVMRLKNTNKMLSENVVSSRQSLQSLTQSTASYRTYRQALKSCNPPCVPFLGVYLSDLVFINAGNAGKVNSAGHELINFGKYRLCFKTIQEIQMFQQKKYDFQARHEIMNLLSAAQSFNMEDPKFEDHLYQLSLQIEPRDKPSSTVPLDLP